VANGSIRREENAMYNDSFMAFFSVCAIAVLVLGPGKSSNMLTTICTVALSSFFLSVSLSIKAGVVLMMPAFLGTIQYRFGISHLLLACSVILAL